MKRFAAILTALAVVIIPCLIIFICGGGAPASTNATSTATQNTTENTKTESTTSVTEAPDVQKPEFLHPAIEEINEGTDKILSFESISADISARIKVFENSGKSESSVFYSNSIAASRLQTGKPIFISEKQTSLTDGLQSAHEKIYFDGESYYISTLGVHAKVPASGAENIVHPKDLLFSVLKPIPSNEKIISSSIEKERNLHLIEISAEKASLFFPEIFASLHKRAESIGAGASAITVKKCELSVAVDANGYIEEYALQVSIAVLAETESGEKADYTLTANISVIFSGAGEVQEPKVPDDLGIFVPMDSQKDIPLVMLKLAADKNSALESFCSREHFYARKKELNGSYTDIEAFLDKAYARGEKTEWLESISLGALGSASPETSDFYFREGLYYFHKNGETESYDEEGFKSAFGFSENGMPALALSSKDVTSHNIYNVGEKLHISVSLTDEALREKFAEHIGKSAHFIADGNEIWNASASGGKLEVRIGESGYIEEYTVSYNARVITNINGTKFAFSSTVQSKTQFSSLGENVEVAVPEWFEGENDTIQ